MLQGFFLALSLTTAQINPGTMLSGEALTASSYSGEVTKMRVQGHRVACNAGSEEMKQCYSVQKGATIGMDSWETLQQPIEGFNFEEGYTYDMIVKVDVLPGKTGTERFRYTLVEIISKIKES